MGMQTALDYLHNQGGPDGRRAYVFAQVDHTNPTEVRHAIVIFGQLLTGIELTDANVNDEWPDDAVWDYVPGSGLPKNPDGTSGTAGHAVTVVGYDATSYKFITWGGEAAWTLDFQTHQVDEAWVVIWPEHFGPVEFLSGIDLNQLAADYKDLTGNELPLPDLELQMILDMAGQVWSKTTIGMGGWTQESPASIKAIAAGGTIHLAEVIGSQ